MNAQFEWIVHELQATPSLDGLQNVVRKIAWEVQARNGNVFLRDQGIAELELPIVSSFVEYQNIDQATALNWLWGIVNKQKTQQQLSDQIEALLEPKLVSMPLPWNQ